MNLFSNHLGFLLSAKKPNPNWQSQDYILMCLFEAFFLYVIFCSLNDIEVNVYCHLLWCLNHRAQTWNWQRGIKLPRFAFRKPELFPETGVRSQKLMRGGSQHWGREGRFLAGQRSEVCISLLPGSMVGEGVGRTPEENIQFVHRGSWFCQSIRGAAPAER